MKNKVLFNFGCIKDRAKVKADWIKNKVITYAEEYEHNKIVDELAEPVEDTLKAFMIINEKNVDVGYLKMLLKSEGDDLQVAEIYNYNCREDMVELDKSDFEILRKTLLNPTARTAQ